MSAVYLNDINLDMIRFYNQGHNQYIRYGKNSFKIIIDDVCITSLERNKYTNKMHIKVRLNQSDIKRIIEIEDHIFGILNITPISYKSMISGEVMDAKIIERYKHIEIDVIKNDGSFGTIYDIKEGDIVNINVTLKNVWNMILKEKNPSSRYGIILVANKIALRDFK